MQNIADFYATNSIYSTADHFGLSLKQTTRVLRMMGVKIRGRGIVRYW